jgi:hypothetical protein
MRYHIIVGNIGTVERVKSPIVAARIYGQYKELSKGKYGRASGESVTIFDTHKDCVALEYVGTNERDAE